ncbi:MAG: SusC/RagA family TonB-linked outer membrane protein [Bacteroidota bacterium]
MNKIVNPNSFGKIKTIRFYLLTIMRIFLLFISIGLGSVYANSSYAQTKMDINVNNITFEEFFKEIQNKSEFIFFYKDNVLDNNKRVSINIKEATLTTILNRAFRGTDLSYMIDDRQVVVKKRHNSSMVPTSNQELLQQKLLVTGSVLDKDGVPLPGASIIEKGTNNGVTTDFDGLFSIDVIDDKAILHVSYLGYTTQEIPVGSRSVINITLQLDAEALDEVVVTALGFTADKRTLGITSSKIDAEEAMQSGETGVINSLSGKASGVKISRSNGDPGAGSSIQIRGANTISGSTQPLIVVDGVPFSNENANGIGNASTAGVSQQSRLNDINQEDIESVTILKGASAAAVWGSLAANGVIVITTKKGRNKDKIDVSYNTTFSFDDISEKHPLQSTFGQGSRGKWRENYSRSWGDKIADRAGGADEFNTDGQYFEARDGTIYYPITTKNSQETFIDKNFDQVFRTGTSYKNNISISGAGDKGNIYFSVGNLNNKGIVKQSYYDKLNVGFNASFKFNDWITLKGKANYINIESNRIQQSSNSNGLYLGLLRNAADVDIEDYIGTYYSSSGTPTELRQRSYRNTYGSKTNSGYNNPLWTIYEQENLNNVDRYIFNLDLNMNPVDWLTIIARGGIDNYLDFRSGFFPMYSSSTRSDGEYYEEKRDLKNLNLDLIGRANFELTDKINSAFTLGYGHIKRERHTLYTRATDFTFNSRLRDFGTLTTDEFISSSNSKSFFETDRVFGTASFDYNNALFLNFSGAYQTFSSASEGIFYPAIDLSWNFSEMDILADSFISYGKLRSSFGQVGVAPSRHQFDTTYELFTYSDYDDPLDISYFGGGFRANDDLGNPDLKPEIKTEFEIGADLKFFDNRFGFNLTYYANEVDDILLDVSQSPSTGFNNQYRNAGRLENYGLEIDWNIFVLKHEDYNLSIYGNFNNNKNEVLDLAGTSSVDLTGGSISSRAIVGQPLGVLFGTKALRNSDGTYDLDDNGFPQLDPVQGILGDPNPDWRGGLGLRANFKGLFFNILFETSQGNDYAERTRFILGNFGTHADVGKEVTLDQDLVNVRGDVFTAGSTVRGNIKDFGAGPVLLDERWYTTRGGGFGSSVINEFAINDGSWTRLREVSLGYTLDSQSFRDNTKLSSIMFSVTGRNLNLWTDVLGVDPEINQTGVSNGFGIDYFTNPTTKSFVFSLQVNF